MLFFFIVFKNLIVLLVFLFFLVLLARAAMAYQYYVNVRSLQRVFLLICLFFCEKWSYFTSRPFRMPLNSKKRIEVEDLPRKPTVLLDWSPNNCQPVRFVGGHNFMDVTMPVNISTKRALIRHNQHITSRRNQGLQRAKAKRKNEMQLFNI